MTTLKNKSTPTEDRQLLANRLDALNQFKIDLGLDRLHQVLGHLQLKKPAAQIITVGGTNGKGSTVAALCSLLNTKNISFGAFTSPHIFAFNERININGQLATDKEILAAFDLIDEAKGDVNLSYFEYAFLAALLLFVNHRVEVIVLEVGLGGRLDATNAMDADATIITTVDIDHTEWLGEDVESIAVEKAGIMRTSKPAVYGDQKVPQAILTQAEIVGAKLLLLNDAFAAQINTGGWCYRFKGQQWSGLDKPLVKGDWQINNFSSAMTAILALGYELSIEEVRMSLANWQVPGRLQTMATEPLVLADVAHNRQAVEGLHQWLTDHPVTGRTYAVFSVLADKQLADWLGSMTSIDHWLVFTLDSARAMKSDPLKLTMADHVSLFSMFDSGQQAHQAALAVAEPDDRIIVFGSFHVLEEVFQ